MIGLVIHQGDTYDHSIVCAWYVCAQLSACVMIWMDGDREMLWCCDDALSLTWQQHCTPVFGAGPTHHHIAHALDASNHKPRIYVMDGHSGSFELHIS